MNSRIFLSFQPDLEDLKKTVINIANSYDNKLNKFSTFFKNLSEAYNKFKCYLNTNKTNYVDFHGLRDFYDLIKFIARKLQMIEKATDEKIIEIGLNSIERNFNGLKKMKEIFAEFYPKNVQIEENKVVESIKNNINDKDSRYLLLINESSYNSFLLESILNNLK